jgi:hypothetical protein
MIKAPSTAHQKFTMTNPLTIWDASMSIRALITSKNNPNVKIVIGKVNNIKIGLITTLIIPSTAATITATRKSAIFIPGKSQQVKYMTQE